MSTKLQPVRGTHDLLPEQCAKHACVAGAAREVAELYGFSEVSTPIFEFTEVFSRTLGDTSDIVTKEMYSFTDRGGDNITLRPEFTAGIARSFISNGLAQALPLKLFSTGPVFRHERPQKGRLRQFHQVNMECLGRTGPYADAEMIVMAMDFLKKLGVSGAELHINSLGDKETRDNYRKALVGYLSGFIPQLSEDSKSRLERNPLRILDSKDEGDRRVIANAPEIGEFYSLEAANFYSSVKSIIGDLGVTYKQSSSLVRGLDYYNHVIFEIKAQGLGSQDTVLAGGRYDGLIKQMGGPETPATGWGAGIERLAELVSWEYRKPRPVVIIPAHQDEIIAFSYKLSHDLRNSGHVIEHSQISEFGKGLKFATKINARYAVLLGETEFREGKASVKNLDTSTQEEIPLSQICQALK